MSKGAPKWGAEELASLGLSSVRELGRGTYGRVVLVARAEGAPKELAAKLYDRGSDAGMECDAVREIAALQRLSAHPNIVQYHGWLPHPRGGALLLLEPMTHNMKVHYREAPQPPPLERHALALLDALRFMHRKGLYHRDVKPQNILCNPAQEVRLADFGSCGVYRAGRCQTHGVCTIWYRAPEYARGDAYTPTVDVWALGCALYEVLNGPLFCCSTPLELTDAHRRFANANDERLRVVQTRVPAIRKMLHPDPARRVGASEAHAAQTARCSGINSHRPVGAPPTGAVMWDLQSEVTARMREVVVDYMGATAQWLDLGLPALVCAVDLLDGYLRRQNLAKKSFQLLALSALMLASKVESSGELGSCDSKMMAELSDGLYSADDLCQMELAILRLDEPIALAEIHPLLVEDEEGVLDYLSRVWLLSDRRASHRHGAIASVFSALKAERSVRSKSALGVLRDLGHAMTGKFSSSEWLFARCKQTRAESVAALASSMRAGWGCPPQCRFAQ